MARRNVATAPEPVPTAQSLPAALQSKAGERAAYVQAKAAGLTLAQLADRLEAALNSSDAVGVFLYGRAAQERLAKGGPKPANGERYDFMPRRGVVWPGSGKPLAGDVNADRLRSLLGRLDGPAKQVEPRETLRRKRADELSEAAGSQGKAHRFWFQSPVGVLTR